MKTVDGLGGGDSRSAELLVVAGRGVVGVDVPVGRGAVRVVRVHHLLEKGIQTPMARGRTT